MDQSNSRRNLKPLGHGLPPLLDLGDFSRKPKFDPIRERDESLKMPVTPGAKAASPILTLPELRVKIQEHPEATVVISDVHGYVELLNHVAAELGVRRQDTTRPKSVGSIGDLIDGRTKTDADALLYAERELDFVVAGNHEMAYMGGPSFGRQPPFDTASLGVSLHRLASQEILVAAQVAYGVLLTHGGINTAYAKSSAEATAESLMVDWQTFLTQPRGRSRMTREPAVLLHPALRAQEDLFPS